MLIYYRDVLPAKVSVRSNYRAYVLNVLAKDHYIFGCVRCLPLRYLNNNVSLNVCLRIRFLASEFVCFKSYKTDKTKQMRSLIY